MRQLLNLSILGVIFCFLLMARPANAYVEFNGFYTSESLSAGSDATSSRMFLEGSIGFRIDKKGRYMVGWNYSLFSTGDNAGSEETAYSSTQMGPRFIYVFNRARTWTMGLTYNLVTTATYKKGSDPEEKWKGMGLKFDIGYNYEVSEGFFFGLRVNYSASSYNEKLIGDTTYSTVSNSKTLMYPSIYAIYHF